MADNTSTNVLAAADGTGPALVEKYLLLQLQRERDFRTVLANSRYGSMTNLPRRKGQFVEYTKRNKIRLPEIGTEGADPQSGAPLSYSKIQAPIEFIKEFVSLTFELRETSWIDVARDAKEVMMEALRRFLHRQTQGALLNGRYLPGKRDTDGLVTTAFFTTPKATFSKFQNSFTFNALRRYFVNNKQTFGELVTGDRHRMSDYIGTATRLSNSGAPKINGKYPTIISDSVKEDLMADDQFFDAAIRNARASDMVFDGQIADYRGMTWIIDDEPWKLQTGNADALNEAGDIHVSFMVGKDAFSYLRLGGQNAKMARFKVQDISKTGSLLTIGYTVPSQVLVLDETFGASITGPVSNPDDNAAV